MPNTQPPLEVSGSSRRPPPAPLPLGLSPGEWGVVGLGVVALAIVAVAVVLVATRASSPSLGLIVAVLVVAALAIAGMLAVSVTLSQRTSARVRVLREVAAELGLGDLAARAPSEPTDDLGALGLSLNTMADRVGRVLQAQRDLLAGVSHELRSPLARMEVALELIRVELERSRQQAPDGVDRRQSAGEQLVAEIQEEVSLLERHISRLLEAQRVSAEKVLLHRQELALDELVSTVVRRERHRLEKLGWRLDLELGAGGAVLAGDENALDRVLSTLVENAVQHAGEGQRELHVETARDEMGAVVRVGDRGPGLTPEQCTRVFEAFFRIDRSRSTDTGGTGLGLYLVKRIVEAHGGTARALPRPGGGLLVELRLPMLGQREFTETVKMQAVAGEDEASRLPIGADR